MTVQAARSADNPVDPSAMMFVIARFLCVWGLAAARTPLISAPRAGNRGIRRRMVGLTIHAPPHQFMLTLSAANWKHLARDRAACARRKIIVNTRQTLRYAQGKVKAITHSATSLHRR